MSEEEDSGIVGEAQRLRRNDHKGGKINIFEPITTRELMASPFNVSYFKHVGYFEFCERVQCNVPNLELSVHIGNILRYSSIPASGVLTINTKLF